MGAWYDQAQCVAAYLFDGEGAGDSAANWATPGLGVLSDTGTVGRSAGAFGDAADFDKAAADILSLAAAEASVHDLSYLNWALVVYAKHSGAVTAVTEPTIVGKEPHSPGGKTYRLYVDEHGALYFKLSADGSTYDVSLSASITVTNDNYIAIVAEGATIKLYVNGELEDSGTYSGTNTEAQDFAVGNVSDDNFARRWNGLVDELAIFARALGQFEVRAIMNSGLAGSDPALTSVIVDARSLLAASVDADDLGIITGAAAVLEPDVDAVSLLNPVLDCVDLVKGEADVTN